MKTDKFTLFMYLNFLVLLSTTVCSENINKQNENIADETLTDYSFLSRYHYPINQRIIWKDDIEFVAEFPCLLGHPVHCYPVPTIGLGWDLRNDCWMYYLRISYLHFILPSFSRPFTAIFMAKDQKKILNCYYQFNVKGCY